MTALLRIAFWRYGCSSSDTAQRSTNFAFFLQLQEKKRELARAALSGDKIKNMRLGMDDLLALFKPGARDDDDEDD